MKIFIGFVLGGLTLGTVAFVVGAGYGAKKVMSGITDALPWKSSDDKPSSTTVAGGLDMAGKGYDLYKKFSA